MDIQLTLGKNLLALSMIFLSMTASCQGNTGHHSASYNSDPLEEVGKKPTEIEASGAAKDSEEKIMDQGLNMLMATIRVPTGWSLIQDVASNPEGSGFLKYILCLQSPEGSTYCLLPPMTKYEWVNSSYLQQSFGHNFDEVVKQIAQHILPAFADQFNLGRSQRDNSTEEIEQIRALFANHQSMVARENQQYAFAGGEFQMQVDNGAFNFSLEGVKDGQKLKGNIKALKLGYYMNMGYQESFSGQIMGTLTMAPSPVFDAMDPDEEVFDLTVNPEWDLRRSQIIDIETQRMMQEHQQRMANRNQQFQQHQSNMQQMRLGFEQQNQSWYERNLGTGGSSSYSSTEQFLDGAITGKTTFNDPYTGQQIKQDGHYNHWYTNEFGEYQGSDDPSYDPNMYGGGNWQPIQPTRPAH